MNTPHRVAFKMAPCEVNKSDKCKDGQIVEVWTQPGNILMCSDCIQLEAALTVKYAEVNRIIIESRKQDEQIQIIPDLFNAKTVAAEELYKAIQSDDSIKPEEKDYAFNREMKIRYERMKEIVLRDELALNEKKTEAAMWKVQLQTTAPRLHAKYQKEFEQFIIAENYSPTPKKPVKSAVPSGKSKLSKAEQLDECIKWAKHYGVESSTVQMLVLTLKKFNSAELAAKSLFDIRAKLSESN